MYGYYVLQLSESDGMPVDLARTFCDAKKISFYRLSPKMDKDIQLDEKDPNELVEMIKLTKWSLLEEEKQLCGIKDDTILPWDDS